MPSRRPLVALIAGTLLMITAPALAAPPSGPRTAPLEAEIARLAKGAAGPGGGTVGVAAWRLDGKGPIALYNQDQAFPLASTYKVPIAGAILEKVDKGQLSLTQMVTVRPEQHVPSETIAARLVHPGVALSVHNLLELMLVDSDNTATDVLFELAGGGAAVTDWVRRQGVEGLRVDSDTNGILRRFYAMPAGGLYEEAWKAKLAKDPGAADRGSLPNPAFDDAPQDTTRPDAMAQLLTRLFRGEALSASSTKVLNDIMERCRTGAGRLVARMPPDTILAHKTGTIGGTVNDVGLITLPGDAGQVIIAVYIKKSDAPVADRERAIAEIGRTVRDFYLFQR